MSSRGVLGDRSSVSSPWAFPTSASTAEPRFDSAESTAIDVVDDDGRTSGASILGTRRRFREPHPSRPVDRLPGADKDQALSHRSPWADRGGSSRRRPRPRPRPTQRRSCAAPTQSRPRVDRHRARPLDPLKDPKMALLRRARLRGNRVAIPTPAKGHPNDICTAAATRRTKGPKYHPELPRRLTAPPHIFYRRKSPPE